MADGTKIEWTDATWNPVRGCARVSEGCRHCYAETVAARFSDDGQPYAGLARRVTRPDGSREARWTGEATFGHNLDQPLSWRRPRRIFVNSMSDLFYERFRATEIATVYGVMIAAHHLRGHTFQVLTKRPARMREILTDPAFWHQVNVEAGMHVMERVDALARRGDDARATLDDYGADKPPPGIWLGVSVEDQPAANDRIPILLDTPAALRWISAEPMLGPVDVRQWQHDYGCGCGWGGQPLSYCPECGWRGRDAYYGEPCPDCGETLADHNACPECDGHDGDGDSFGPNSKPRLDWVVGGFESGRNARPGNFDDARSLRDQCARSGTPFLWKQNGEYLPADPDMPSETQESEEIAGRLHWPMHRIGKKAAGRLLDGVLHDGFPEVRR